MIFKTYVPKGAKVEKVLEFLVKSQRRLVEAEEVDGFISLVVTAADKGESNRFAAFAEECGLVMSIPEKEEKKAKKVEPKVEEKPVPVENKGGFENFAKGVITSK